MTRSFGGPGGSPGREPQKYGGREPVIQPVRVDLGKRVVALIIDFFACYLVGAAVTLIPFVNTFLQLTATMTIVFLSRDFFFEGRGLGKNLMGLQVVDVTSGRPCNLLQSVQRNIIILAPAVVVMVVDSVLRFVPVPFINDTVKQVITLIGTVYVAVVIPMEAYRVYSRADGVRFGDDIAGTALVESPMDFSKFLPRQ